MLPQIFKNENLIATIKGHKISKIEIKSYDKGVNI